MSEENATPAIRFKGFTDPWEQRKLGEVANVTMGQSPQGKNYTENPSDAILVQGNADLKNGWVTPRVWTKEITKSAKPGDLIMSVRAPVGAVGKTAYNVVLGRGVAGICGNEFIYQTLVKMDEDGSWLRFSAGSTFDSINSDILKSTKILMPDIKEQKEIGDFCAALDSLITLHQRKYDKLCNVKKSMLDKMFPKDGETVPEIRFKGFTDPWEQRKLGDIVKVTMGQSPQGKNYTENPSDAILVQGNADLIDGWVTPRVWTKEITKTAKPGDLIMSVRAPVGAVGKTAYNVVLGRGVAGISGNEFIFQTLVKMDAGDAWSRLSAGSTFDSINSDILRSTKILVPDIQEQKMIGDLCAALDSLITLHQRKLTALKNIKQSLLDGMFV